MILLPSLLAQHFLFNRVLNGHDFFFFLND